MQFLKYRGKRIRASDKALVFRFSGSMLMCIFFASLMVFNVKKVIQTVCGNISLFSQEWLSLSFTIDNLVTILLATSA